VKEGREKLDKAKREADDKEIEQINKRKLAEILRIRNQKVIQNMQMNEKPIRLSDSSFDTEISKHPLFVVDFWAPWCGPCRMVGPIIEELARDYSGKVTFGKINIDENPITANQFQVQSIPTFLIFKNGQIVDAIVGAMPRSVLESKIKPYLSDM
jgi:thioredoxin 1